MADAYPDKTPRAVTYPYRRIDPPSPTPANGPDPYGEHDPAWLGIDWNEHTGWAELSGTRVRYAAMGPENGDLVLMVHGVDGCWQNWLENIPALAGAGYRCVAIDLPGFGASPMPEWEISVPAWARVVDEARAWAGAERAHLCGNSLGGAICAAIASGVVGAERAAAVQSLTLVSAAGVSHAETPRRPTMAGARILGTIAPALKKLTVPGLRRPRSRAMAFQSVFRHPDLLRPELLVEWSNGNAGEAFVDAVDAITGWDILDRLDRIEVPVQLIWGRDDVIVPASEALGYKQRLPDAPLHIFEECAHAPMAERPVRFNRLMLEFLR